MVLLRCTPSNGCAELKLGSIDALVPGCPHPDRCLTGQTRYKLWRVLAMFLFPFVKTPRMGTGVRYLGRLQALGL
jgi:hypothetical protein